MSEIEKLAKLFGEFPGIGPRQAKRFVYFLMTKSPEFTNELLQSIKSVRQSVNHCSICKRIFQSKSNSEICNVCSDKNRDEHCLMIVARDIDFETMEKSNTFKGRYFVLGGTIPYLEKEPEKKIRSKELEKMIRENGKIQEVIISMNATPDGDNTGEFVSKIVKNVENDGRQISIYTLGRGLSTGSELEYVDKETISNALANKVKM